jgi:hypothetical protein
VPANRAAREVLSQWSKLFLTLFSDGDPITRGLDEELQRRIPRAKGLLFLAVPPFQNALYGDFQVVVAEAVRDTLKMMERLHVSQKEGFLLLAGEGHHEQAPRVAQTHVEQLSRDALAAYDGYAFPPIHLPIGAWVELEGDVHLGPFLLSPHLSCTGQVQGC